MTLRSQEAEPNRSERQRYRETQTELAHANRVATMGQLTASIAHEVNQPFTAAASTQAGLRFLIQRSAGSGGGARSARALVKNADRGGEIIGRFGADQESASAKDGWRSMTRSSRSSP